MNSCGDESPDSFHLQPGKGCQDVIFTRKVVEEGSLADVRGIGNILDGRSRKSAFGKKG